MTSTLLAAALLSTATLAQGFPTELDEDVERAARSFRIETYNAFRTERGEYDRRVNAARQLVDRWSRAGQPAQRREEILEWFQKAAAVNDASPLPADVEFQADAVDPSISSPPPISLAPPRRAAPDLLNGQPADSAGTRDTGPAPYRPLTSLGTAVIKAVPKSNPFDFVTGNRWRRLRPPTSAPSAPHATVRQPDDA